MKCIIVDDEPLAREGVKMLMDEYDELELVGEFGNANAAALYLLDNQVDLIFLDIQMPGITGLEFARSIPKATLVIFTTAYSEFALESYDVDALDYLLKPIAKSRFDKAVKKALSYHGSYVALFMVHKFIVLSNPIRILHRQTLVTIRPILGRKVTIYIITLVECHFVPIVTGREQIYRYQWIEI